MMKFIIMATALVASPVRFSLSASAETVDTSIGRHLAEIGAVPSPRSPKSGAPSFVDISRMPSTNERAIKVFLLSSHPTMPNIILSPDEIDSLAAYIVSLARN